MTNKRRQPHAISTGALWFGVLGGPLAWILRLIISYAYVPLACAQDGGMGLHLISLVLLAVTVAAGATAWRNLSTLRDDTAPADLKDPADPLVDAWGWERARFMAQLGVLVSILFVAVILTEWVTTFFIDPCVIR